MNKTILIASGASVASLAAGAAGGYFYARKKFNDALDELIATETEKVKKHYGILLAQVKEEKPPLEELVKDIVEQDVNLEDDEPSDEQILAAEANSALTNYQGISTKMVGQQEKPPIDTLVENNIFNKKPRRPPRDEHGKFVSPVDKQVDDPFLISDEDFLRNDLEHDQENILWFPKNKTLIKQYSEEIDTVDIALVGEVNLTLFDPTTPEDEENTICVRNTGIGIDYEIKLMHMDLTEYMGLDTEADAGMV